MKVLIIGAYGLIGSAIAKHLSGSNYQITGLGRSVSKGRSLVPEINWLEGDISKFSTATQWEHILENVDIVINAAGALQDGLKDDLATIHVTAIKTLLTACENCQIQRLIHISAPDAHLGSSTEFYRSKARGDELINSSPVNSVILRPGLVLAPQAYGGSALLRAIASFPLVQPIILERAQIKTVNIHDLCSAVQRTIENSDITGDYDVMESTAHTLLDVVLAIRKFLGFKPPLFIIRLPQQVGVLTASFFDFAGWLGWRSPLRSTSFKVLRDGIQGSSKNWSAMTQIETAPLEETLRILPSTLQERIYARSALLFPAILLIFSLFWIISGVIGLLQIDNATALLTDKLPKYLSATFVLTGSLADITIGLLMLWRSKLRIALFGSILISIMYMVGAIFLTPTLWLDPLGPFVKILPVICTALLLLAFSEDR